jgi:uncharacterized membrane protein YhaH (DUF805 family)
VSKVAAEGLPFDTVNGLPLHPLVVHAAVVLLPLSAIGLIVIAFVPKWRRTYGWLVLLGLFVSVAASFLAKESGEQLAEQVGEPERHAELGDVMPLIAFALFVVAAVWLAAAWRVDRAAAAASTAGDGPAGRSILTTILAVVAVVAAVVAIVWMVLVGDSGAKAVWADASGVSPTPCATCAADPS